MFPTGSGQHYEEIRHEVYDPTKFPPRNAPVIPIPPQPIPIPANAFSSMSMSMSMSNVNHNANPSSRHFSRGQPLTRNDTFPTFTNVAAANGSFDPDTSPFFDSNSRLHDVTGPPVIPVPNGMGGFMLAGGVNLDGTPVLGAGAAHISSPMPPPAQFQQRQGMGMSNDGRQEQRFSQGPSASSSQPAAHGGPVQVSLSRPSWAQGSTGPPAWLMSSTTTAPATSSQAQAQVQPQGQPQPQPQPQPQSQQQQQQQQQQQAAPTYASPYVMPHLVQQGGGGSGPTQYYGPQPPVTSAAPPPIHNTTEFTRESLIAVLDRFSEMLEDYFDMEPQSPVWPSPPHGTPPHLTPPYGVATGSGNGNAEASGSGSGGGEKRKPKPTTLRMAVHGGACMLLHQGFYSLSLDLPLAEPSNAHSDPHARGGAGGGAGAGGGGGTGGRPLRMSELARRTTTRDVDIILRGFLADFGGLGPPPNPGERIRRNPTYPGEGQPNDPNPDGPTRVAHLDAASRLKACIRNTARYFPGMGLDWMNADPDVALPLGADPQTKQTFDPLHRSTFTSNNIKLFTVYTSPNKRLLLVSVPPYWSIALKIARWGPRDWADVGILLRAGTLLSQTQWTEETLMEWLKKNCWAMGYAIWEERKVNEMRERVRAAVAMIEGWEPGFAGHSSQPQVQRPPEREREPERPEHRGPPVGHAVMPLAVRENVRNWGSKEEKKRSMSRPRMKSRSKSRGPPEIFVPPPEDGDYADYDGGYGYRDYEEPRGRPHHHRHPSGHIQSFAPPLVRGPSSGALSQATAVAPFFHQPQIHSVGGHNQRAWRRRSTSRSRNRDNKKAKKVKTRDRQRRFDHQLRTEVRSEWTVPSDSESETESEDSEDDSDDDEEDKENRDGRKAWRQSNIYGPSKKRPTPLNIAPNTFPPPQPPPYNPFLPQHQQQQQQQQQREFDGESRQPFYSHPPQQQQGSSQQDVQSYWQQPPQPPSMFTQPHLQPHTQHRSSPRPPPPPPPPINADPATLAQYQFEQQMLTLKYEKQREQQVKETMGLIAMRVMRRGRV